jgi:aromatic ring-opening dioxygenase LigB subunit
VIPELSPDGMGTLATRAAMTELGRRCAEARPDVIVLATPHGVRVSGQIALAAVARAAGTLHHEGRTFEMNLPVDLLLTEAIAETAHAAGLPVVLTGFAGNRRDESAVPLDWGTVVPLAFLGHPRSQTGHGHVLADRPARDDGPPVVIVSPSRALPWHTNVEFGRSVADAAAADGRRVAFVASCDWAHAHPGSRYGGDPAAKIVDDLVVEALTAGQPRRLMELDPELVDRAAIDGLWQALMLAGVLERVPMTAELLCYEAPAEIAVGLATVVFTPVEGPS